MKGFKDKNKKFHPINQKIGVRKKRIPTSEMLKPTGGVKLHLSHHNEGIRLKRTILKKNPAHLNWGFDNTDFEPEGFQKVLKNLEIPQEFARTWHEADPELNLERQGRGFLWEGEGIMIETKNNPITGQYGNPKQREPEKDYASYIGITGLPDQVGKAVKLIKENSRDLGTESKNRRDFI